MYAPMKHLHLTAVAILGGVEVAAHIEFQLRRAMLAALQRYAGIEAYAPYPCIYVATVLEALEAMPQLNKYLLEEVVGLVATLGEHEAHGVDCAAMLANDISKFLFLLCHSLSLKFNRPLFQSFYSLDAQHPLFTTKIHKLFFVAISFGG